MNDLPPLVAVEVKSLGQIGAGKVVEFIPKHKKRWIPLPRNARTFDQFTEFEVCGNSLEDLGILNGNLLTCRTNFEISEVKPTTVCLLYIHPWNDYTVKMIRLNDDKTVTLLGASKSYEPQNFFADEIEVLAIALEVRRTLRD